MSVQVQPNKEGPYYEIQDFPQTVTCQVTTAWPEYTTLTDDGVTDAVAGIIQTFTVTLFDSGNNRLTIGGDTLGISMEPT
jgi:hypothetical protein